MLARITCLLLASACTASLTGVAAPARAAEVLGVTAVDSGQPGVVSATVSTDVDSVWVTFLELPERGHFTGEHKQFAVVDGTVHVTMPTWGLDPAREYQLEVSTCQNHALEGCLTELAPFVASDVAPELVWSTDRELTGTEEASLAVTDAGGGQLKAMFPGLLTGQPLTSGEQELLLPEGTSDVTVARCSPTLGCHTFETELFAVAKGKATALTRTTARVVPDATSAPDTEAGFLVQDPVPYRFVGHALTAPHAAREGRPLIDEEVVPDAQGVISIPVDLSALPLGPAYLVGTLERTTEAGAVRQHVAAELPSVSEPRAHIESVNVSTGQFFPAPDDFRDLLKVTAKVTNGSYGSFRLNLEHLDTGERIVVFPSQHTDDRVRMTWDGLDAEGQQASEGRWTVSVSARQGTGGHELIAGEVELSWQQTKVVRRTITVGARTSMSASWAKQCARVSEQPSRSWKRGIAHEASRCHGDGGLVAVTSDHALRVPQRWVSGRIALEAYGGAALGSPRRPRSQSRIALLNPIGDQFGGRLLRIRPGWDGYGDFNFERALAANHRLRWRVMTYNWDRYDLRDFRITFTGRALQ